MDDTVEFGPVQEFWRWWSGGAADRFAEAIRTGDYGTLNAEMNARVSAIHSQLEWETGRGEGAENTLCVTAVGDPALRPLAERWRLAGPPSGGTWEYVAARRADPEALSYTLGFGGWNFDLKHVKMSLRVDERAMRVDVAVHHPMFAETPKDAQWQLTYLVLNWLLGEDDVERWIGEIATSADLPTDALPADALTDTVRALAARHAEPVWVLLEGNGPDGNRLIATALRPLRWIDHPLLDLHVAVTFAYGDRRFDGIPSESELEKLRALEDELTAVLGSRAMLVAHETANGRRTLHYYADSDDAGVYKLAEQWAQARPPATFEAAVDPGWAAVRHLS